MWVGIEQESIPKLPLHLYLYSSEAKTIKKQTKNPFLKNTISVWFEAHKHINDVPTLSQFSPIWGNDQFIPARNDGGFKLWFVKGIQKIMDLYVDGVMLSFDLLCRRYQIPKKHFFKYLQLKSFISSKCDQVMYIPPLSTLEKTLKLKTFSPGR